MRNWLDKIPDNITLLAGAGIDWNRSALQSRIQQIREALASRKWPQAPVAILADNSPEWIAIDLATQELGIALIPLPSFFTPTQWMHAIDTSGAQAIFCMQEAHARLLGFDANISLDSNLSLYEATQEKPQASLHGIQKITFTSGTTAEPKGVCLSTEEQWNVARAIHSSIAGLGIQRHLSLLPLAVLLENIAGVYTGMLCGASIYCPPVAETGLTGASRFDPQLCLEAIYRYRAESVILLPQMLQAIVAVMREGDERTGSLKFVAVGGAKTPVALIHAARKKGLPVFEGYGLSECCSVVSLNLPGKDRPGSAGMPLSNRQLRITAEGEIEVRVPEGVRYLGQPPSETQWLATGDIGHVGDDGFLFLDGRKKNVLITGFGRNVSPEWPESVLLGTGLAAQVIVFGDGRPYLIAAIVPASPQIKPEVIQAAIDQANQTLPDYARIRRWIAVESFTPANRLATANGRPKRNAIWERYRLQLESLYESAGE